MHTKKPYKVLTIFVLSLFDKSNCTPMNKMTGYSFEVVFRHSRVWPKPIKYMDSVTSRSIGQNQQLFGLGIDAKCRPKIRWEARKREGESRKVRSESTYFINRAIEKSINQPIKRWCVLKWITHNTNTYLIKDINNNTIISIH